MDEDVEQRLVVRDSWKVEWGGGTRGGTEYEGGKEVWSIGHPPTLLFSTLMQEQLHGNESGQE